MNTKRQRKLRKVREKLRYTSKKYTFAVRVKNRNMYVLVMCSQTRNVLTQVSTLTPSFKSKNKKNLNNVEVAKLLGQFAYDHITKKGYGNSFAFDRGDRKYVGRVKAVIDSAVSAGLSDQKTEGA